MLRASENVTGSGHRYSLLVSLIVILTLGSFLGWFFLERRTDKTPIKIGGQQLYVDVADSHEERTQGLSGRQGLEPREGMLFVFENNENTCIWMKNMLFPIDILWFDKNKILIDVKRDVSPDTYPESFCPRSPAKYVVELPAGSSNAFGWQLQLTELETVAF